MPELRSVDERELESYLRGADVIVIGGGLAGSEAALQVASRGRRVLLLESRPHNKPPAFHSDKLGELVCSNSLGAYMGYKAPTLLKEELKIWGSNLIEIALKHRVPAGQSLAVDRWKFADELTRRIVEHPNILLVRYEVKRLPNVNKPIIVATGPLTTQPLAEHLRELIGQDWLHFFDAASPIVDADSINWDKVFKGARYGLGEGEYINCPLTKEEYDRFWEELVEAEVVPLKDFESDKLFEGCLPIEEIAKRGRDTLRYGPMKPVGLIDPRTGREPYAVVQLRPENDPPTMYSMVGFQTRLKWSEQRRVFRLIPGLEEAIFVRYGVMHKNIFVNSPLVLNPTLQLKVRRNVLLAGQITGSEGYTENIATGLIAGVNALRMSRGEEPAVVPRETIIGALIHYLTHASPDSFQPMNVNFNLLPPLDGFEDLPEVRELRDRLREARRRRDWEERRKLKRALGELKGKLMFNRSLEVLRRFLREVRG